MKRVLGVIAAIALVFLPLAVYQPSLHGGFLWDDDAHVVDRAAVHDPAGLWDIWFTPGAVQQYYPVAHTGFWAQYQLWGTNPFGYRVTNALLHGLASLLVWLILRKLRVPGALLAAAVFAVHPVHVESVAWISELKNVLSGALYLGAMYLYLIFLSPLDQPPATRRRWVVYGLSMALFLGAILSKSVTCTLPAAIMLILWWQRPRWDKRDLIPLVPMFVLGVGMGLVTVLMEKHFVGAQGVDFGYSPLDRLLIAGRVASFYAGKLLWPAELIFFYPRWVIDAGAMWQYLFPLGVLAALVTLVLLHGRLGKGPAVGALFFVGTLFPALGFFDVYPFIYSFVADHFQYLASLGLIALGCGAATWLVHRLAGKAGRPIGGVAGVALVAILSLMSWRYCQAFNSLETLYLDIIAKNPRAWMAQNNLGTYYIQQGRWDEARQMVSRSLTVRPDNDRALNNMALIHQREGNLPKAIESYKRSLQINRADYQACVALGMLLVETGRHEEARLYFRAVMEKDPAYPGVKLGMARSYSAQGKAGRALPLYRELLQDDPKNIDALTGQAEAFLAEDRLPDALRSYRQALEVNPHLPEVQNNLAALLMKMGKSREAVQHYRAALADRPTMLTARRNLARALSQIGKPAEAVVEYRQVLLAEPRDIEALLAVADAEVATNDLDSAMQGYQQVIRLDPLNAQAYNQMGWVHLLRNEDAQALESFRKALQLSPDLVEGWFNLGQLMLKQQHYDDAAKAFDAVIKRQPRHGPAHFQRGWIHEVQKQEKQAIAAYRQAIELMPQGADAMVRLAWILATTTDRSVRSPQEAITLATQANQITKGRRPAVLDTLAVAQASAGQYEEAVATAKTALGLAKRQKEADLLPQIASHLALFQAGKPLTTPAP